jgi:hypothetical protein
MCCNTLVSVSRWRIPNLVTSFLLMRTLGIAPYEILGLDILHLLLYLLYEHTLVCMGVARARVYVFVVARLGLWDLIPTWLMNRVAHTTTGWYGASSLQVDTFSFVYSSVLFWNQLHNTVNSPFGITTGSIYSCPIL